MTREEAKAILLQSKMQCEYPHGAYGVAVDIAIKALEQKAKYRAKARRFKRKYLLLKQEYEALKAGQEPKTGHWIWNDEKTYCKCSECGIGMGHTEYDYCPNCGAKMESEVSE